MNESGLSPLGVAVLVKEYKPERKIGVIVIPENVKGRQAMIDARCEVVAIGPNAWHDEIEPRAKVGDIVLVSQFTGFMAGGADGQLYRVVNDRDIFCGMDAAAFDKKALEDLQQTEEAA